MELGCSTILYGGHSLEEALAGIAKAGYTAIELCSIPGMAEHLVPGQPEAYYAEVRKKVEEAGLVVESVGASTNLLDPDARRRFEQVLEAAAQVGAPAVTTGSGGKSDEEESYRLVVRTINELAEVAAKVGVKLSIKPHVRCAVYDTATAYRFMHDVDPTWVGLNFDASHIWRTPHREDPVASLRRLKPWILTARIRDTLGREIPIGPVETQVPGGGALPLRELAEELKTVPGLRYVTLEIVGTKGWPLERVQEVVERSYEALAPLLLD